MANVRKGTARYGMRMRDERPTSGLSEIVRPERYKAPSSGLEVLGYVLMGAGALLLYFAGEDRRSREEGRQ